MCIRDSLQPLNVEKAVELHFAVFNRSGQLVFQTRDPIGKWDGRMNGQKLEAGLYVWVLSYRLPGSLEKTISKGTSILIR